MDYTKNQFETSGIKIEKNFISSQEADLLCQQILLYRTRTHFKDGIPLSNKYHYTDNIDEIGAAFSLSRIALLESLFFLYTEKLETIIDKKLIPSYAFSRIYYEESELVRHSDRPSCEISVTIPLSDYNWPIFINSYSGNTITCNLDKGDALIYKGIDLSHWRLPLEVDEHVQVFLHWVDANGPYKDYAFDGRGSLEKHPSPEKI